ncbi:MAG: adenylyltransferase/cytidyltransferase family protein, partial [Halobacteriota archaeon]|nr:adenylyltransferase/cytidyltransferase family protein [Halobacteriota archaeon]
MVRVLATGTFDILHPGHLTYFREAKKLGDELIVIVARDVNVTHKPKPIIPEEQRVEMVGALSIVDKVILG